MQGHGASREQQALVDTGTPSERLYHFFEWQLDWLTRISASPVALAAVLLPLGEIDKTFEQLNRALDERSLGILQVPSDPRADAFRNDERFLSLIDRLGIPIEL